MLDNTEYFLAKGYDVSIQLYTDKTSGPLLNVNITGSYKGHFYVCYFDAVLYANDDGSLYVKLDHYFPDPNNDVTEKLGPFSKGTLKSEIIDNILEAVKKYI